MWRYHLTSTPWRAGVTYGILFGAVNGVVFGAEGPSAVVGLVVGVIAGTFYGILVGLEARHPLAALAGLSAGDRATVMQTVHRGLATTDRRLAPAVVSDAEAVRRRDRKWVGTKAGVRSLQLFAGLQVLLAVDAAMERDWVLAAATVMFAVTLVLVPGSLARAAVRQDRAEQHAGALLN